MQGYASGTDRKIGRRLRLTSPGEELVRQSRRLLMKADLLPARARALHGGQTGILRVGATLMVIEHTLSPLSWKMVNAPVAA